jgi:hypothetical protein
VKKSDRVALVHSRAFQYARSGEYPNWYLIELQLRREGLPEARSELDEPVLRAQLNEICRKHHAQSSD